MALDRKAIGDSLVKGPFTAIYPGGLSSGTSFYDRNSTVYYPFDLEGAKAELAKAGLKDTDGNGVVNFPAGTLGGKDVEIVMNITTTMIKPNEAMGPSRGPIRLVSVSIGLLGANISTSTGSLGLDAVPGAPGRCSALLSSRPTLSTTDVRRRTIPLSVPLSWRDRIFAMMLPW